MDQCVLRVSRKFFLYHKIDEANVNRVGLDVLAARIHSISEFEMPTAY